jgi:outer membrane protein assembly complex protein YaeT
VKIRTVPRIAGLLLAGCAALAILLLGLAHTPPVRRYVLASIERLAGPELALRISALDYNLVAGSVELRGVTLGPGPRPFFHAERVTADLDAAGLLWNRKVVVDRAAAEGVAVDIAVDEQGRSNLPVLPDDGRANQLPDFLIRRFSAGGRFTYEDGTRRMSATLPAWTLEVAGADGPRHAVRFGAGAGGRVEYQGRERAVQVLQLSAQVTRDAVQLGQFRVAMAGLNLDAAGSADGFADPGLDLRVNLGVDLEPAFEFAGIERPAGLAGHLDFAAALTNPLSRVAMDARVAGSNLVIDRLRRVALDARMRWSRMDRVLTVDRARVETPEGIAVAQATWSGTAPQDQNRASARIERLDLARVSRLLQLPVEIASGAAGTVDAQWRGLELESGTARVNLRLSPARAEAAQNVIPVGGEVSVQARNREVTITARSVEALGVAAEADVVTHLRTFDLAGAVRLSVPDAGAALARVNAFRGLPGGADLGGQPVAGQAEVRVQLGGTFERPTASAVLEGSGIRYGPVQNLALAAEADYDPARLAVRDARITWNGAEARASATLGLEGGHPLAFAAQTGEISLSQALAALKYDYPVTGRIALQAQAQGTLDNPRISASIQGRELTAYQQPLGDLASNVSFAGRTLTLDSLRLDAPDNAGSLTASGSYTLDTRGYSLNAEGTDIVLASLKLPGEVPLRGVVNLKATGAGTLENPAGSVNLNLRDLSVEGREVGAMSAEIRVADRSARLSAEIPAFQIRAEAEAGTAAPYPLTARVTANGVDLAALPWGAAEPPVRGRITATLEASGEPERWSDGKAAVEIADLLLETPLGAIRNAEPIRAAVVNRAVQIETLRLAGAGSTLSVSGTMPLEASAPPGAIHYEAHADLAALTETAAKDAGFAASGTVDLAGDLTGTLARATPSGRFAVRGGRLAASALRSPLERVEADAVIEGGRISIAQLQASLGTALIRGQGSVPLGLFPLPPQIDVPPLAQPARLQASVTGLSLGSVAQLPEGAGGAVTLAVEAEAARAELEAVSATVTIQQAIFSAAGMRVQTTSVPPVISLRNGTVNIDRFDLQGTGTEFHVSGGASLTERQLRDVRLNGTINAGLLRGLSEAVSAAGAVNLQVAANGPFSEPSVNGFLEVTDGRVSVAQPRLDVAGLNVRAGLNGRRVEIERLQAELNGGRLTGSGGADLSDGVSPDLRITANDVYLDFPEGLQTRSTTDLRLSASGGNLLLSGSVLIHEGAYTEPLDLQTAFEGYLGSGGGVELVEERTGLLNRLRFDIGVATQDPIVMDNNLGELAFDANLRLTGNYYRPGLTGQVNIRENGRLRLQENDYVIERGVINFVNEARIEPAPDIVANTQVRGRVISVHITADERGKLDAGLSSDNPEDTQADIVALLLTGKDAEELEGRELTAASERAAASLVLGSLTGRLSQGLQSGLGLSRVRLEPNLISQESDPTARLTIGQDLTRQLELIYSMNLRNSSDQIWSSNYNILPSINTRATKQPDNSYRFDFQHDLRFGSRRTAPAPDQTPRASRRVRGVTFTGDPQLPLERLRDRFDVRPGQEYDFFAVRGGLDRLEDLYRDAGRLEARLRLHREDVPPDGVDLNVEIQAGPQIEFVFEGWSASGGLRRRVRDEWRRGVFDAQRIALSTDQIRLALGEEGYLQAAVEAEVQMPDEGRKRVLFTIDPGRRYAGVETVFTGAAGIDSKELARQLKRAKLDDKMESNPAAVRQFLTQYYRQQGFLDASVAGPEFEFDPESRTAHRVIVIAEGPRYRFGQVNVTGATAFTADEIRAIAGIPAGTSFTPAGAQESRDRLEEEYWKKGYRDVEVEYTLARDAESGVVNVDIGVTEGQVSVVQSIEVQGNDRTSEEFVRKQIELMTGDVLDYTKTAESRRRLYETGAFSSVEIRSSPVENPDVAAAMKPVRLLATVQEPNPFRFRYGGFYDTDRGVGFITDFRNRNSLGGGRVLGFRTRYDNDVREGRVFFSQPLLRSLPIRTDAAAFLRREFQRNTLEDGTRETFITDRIGFSVQEGWRLQNKFFLTLGYRFERAHTFDVNPQFIPFDVVLRVAPLTTSLTRDTRDELLDATTGSFTSHAFELSTQRLGSSLSFWRYFGQYFKYIPLTRPAPLPFGRGLEKPRVVYAGGVRVGLANTFGGQEELARSERFFTGGGTTIRGFQQDQVGPKDFLGAARGGEAALIVNNELRFPVAGIFDGVGFLDLGNVYTRLEDFSLSNIRKTAGMGVRVRTPYFLLRLDYGLKLDRQPGESRGALFFSIGQAF